jgi:hypothetical protein
MRVNLNTPYSEKDTAKALGARWDAARRVWFIIDPQDLTPFMRWIPSEDETQKAAKPPVAKPHKKQRHKYGITKSVPVPHCGCNVLPWEHCVHTEVAGDLL